MVSTIGAGVGGISSYDPAPIGVATTQLKVVHGGATPITCLAECGMATPSLSQ